MAAKDAEIQERPVIISSHLQYQKRTSNQAIRSRREIQTLVLLHKLDQIFLEEYDKCPLKLQLGFIPAISEEEFNIATVTIIDVGFLGFFPKKLIFQALRKYDSEIQRCSPVKKMDSSNLLMILLWLLSIGQ